MKEKHQYRPGRSAPNNLRDQVGRNAALWATPKARDYRTGTPKEPHEDFGLNLNNQTSGQLFPAWVATLMGYPDDWLHSSGRQGEEKRSKTGSLPAPSPG